MPFLAADAGNFLGGGISSYLIGRGVSVGTARKLVIAVGGARHEQPDDQPLR